MKSITTKKSTLILLFILFLVTAVTLTLYLVQRRQEIRQKAAPATTLYFSESTKRVALNTSFSVDAMINANSVAGEGNAIAGVELHVKFDPNILTAQSIDLPSTNAFLPDKIKQDINNTTGTIYVALLSNKEMAANGTGALATITFTAKSLATSSQIYFDELNTKVAGASGEDLGKQVLMAGGTTPIQITVAEVVLPSATPLTSSIPVPSPSPTPSPTAIPIITRVGIHPSLINIKAGQQVGMSALAYIGTTPQFSGVTYEWGISSTGSIGTLLSINGNIATFKALNVGTGDIWVKATNTAGSLTNSIPVTVQPPDPSPTPEPMSLNLKFAFQGVRVAPTWVIQVNVDVTQGDLTIKKLGARVVSTGSEVIEFIHPNGERFSQSFAIFKLENDIIDSRLKSGVATTITVKGPMHLSRKLTDTIGSGRSVFDFTQVSPKTMLAGDIYNDNIIDIHDYNRFVEDFGKTTFSPADLNMDGVVDIWDYDYIPSNFGSSGE